MKWTLSDDLDEEDESPPSRGAWIEIVLCHLVKFVIDVAPLAGGVD